MKGLIFLLLFALTTSFVSADLLKVDPGATTFVSQQAAVPQVIAIDTFFATAAGWFAIVALVVVPIIFFKARRLKRVESRLLQQRSLGVSNSMKTIMEAYRTKSRLLRSRLQTA
jgi:hypothetical protein